MNGPDDEFDDFLRKRRPLFGPSDPLEPPAEIDRIVLRQAREAIEAERPQRHFRAPSWGMPVALAATLVLAFTIILRVGMPTKEVTSEVTVQNVSRKVELPAAADTAAAPMAPAPVMQPRLEESMARAESPAESDAPVVVDLNATAETEAAPARRYDKLADVTKARSQVSTASEAQAAPATAGASAPAAAEPVPDWRRDSKTWMAEIERLRASGDVARADAELTEFKRQHRALAVAPDR